MKILYAIQGTGNGHVVRANEILPLLTKYADVHVLLSSTENEVSVNMPITHKLTGLGFVFGKHGGINYRETWTQAQVLHFLKEVKQLPIAGYDLVINDFEPVSAWAAKLHKTPVFSMSHQYAVMQPAAPHAHHADLLSKNVLYHYAPVKSGVGFHFKRYNENILTPVIRQDVQQTAVTNDGHYTVYLPAYEDEFLIRLFREFHRAHWHIFSKRATEIYYSGNCKIGPIDANGFLQSMAASDGVLTGAGFETPAEALFLKKKLMVVPMKGQYEQQCNAAALHEMGVPVLHDLNGKNVLSEIGRWANCDKIIDVHYPDVRREAIERVLEKMR